MMIKKQIKTASNTIKTDFKNAKKLATDGCTGVPDFIFTECCDHHDLGYEYGNSRIKEDNKLFVCMRKTLISNDKNNGLPFLMPYIFWIGVRLFGASRFKGGVGIG